MVHYGPRNLQRTAPDACTDDSTTLPWPAALGHPRARLAPLLDAVAATVYGPGLTLTGIGRRFGGAATLRNRVKRTARLLGNSLLQGQARMIYTALAQKLLRGVSEPLIGIDWSDLKADQSLHLLRASLPVGGRSLTLYAEVHPQGKLRSRQVQHRFLRRLAPLLPTSAAPIIPASGFQVPRTAGLALGRAGARARFRQAQAPEELPAPVRGGDRDLPWHRGVSTHRRYARSSCWRASPKQGRQAKNAAGQRARRRARRPRAVPASLGCWRPRRALPTGPQSGWCGCAVSGFGLSSASGS